MTQTDIASTRPVGFVSGKNVQLWITMPLTGCGFVIAEITKQSHILAYAILSGSLLALGALFGSLSAVFLMDAVGRKASLLAFSVMSLFIGWTLLMAASQARALHCWGAIQR